MPRRIRDGHHPRADPPTRPRRAWWWPARGRWHRSTRPCRQGAIASPASPPGATTGGRPRSERSRSATRSPSSTPARCPAPSARLPLPARRCSLGLAIGADRCARAVPGRDPSLHCGRGAEGRRGRTAAHARDPRTGRGHCLGHPMSNARRGGCSGVPPCISLRRCSGHAAPGATFADRLRVTRRAPAAPDGPRCPQRAGDSGRLADTPRDGSTPEDKT
jgi:hypothetical protein